MSEKQVVPLTYGELMLLTEGHGTTPIYEHIGALAAELATQVDAKMQFAAAVDNLRDERTALQRELATVKAEYDGQELRIEALRHHLDRTIQQRDHWKAEAVWAVQIINRARENRDGIFFITVYEEQRAQAILKEAGDE